MKAKHGAGVPASKGLIAAARSGEELDGQNPNFKETMQ
jgi:hypothetical protein